MKHHAFAGPRDDDEASQRARVGARRAVIRGAVVSGLAERVAPGARDAGLDVPRREEMATGPGTPDARDPQCRCDEEG